MKQVEGSLSSVRWAGDRIELLDQRQLPESIVYVVLRSPENVWEAIRHMKVRGAPAIGICAAFGLCLGVMAEDKEAPPEQWLARLKKDSAYLATSRPTAVNLFWALARMEDRAELWLGERDPLTHPQFCDKLVSEALLIQSEDAETCRLIGVHALSLFEDGFGILTHCNAGSLATAKYGTALAPLYLAREKGMALKIFVDETRPVLQGARLTAFELQQAGIDVTLICDNTAGMVMAKGWIQAVIVGTDRVAANGDVANKIGTYSVAVLAKAHRIPFYVACPISTIDMNTSSGDDIPIEERDGLEVTHGFGKRTAPEGVNVFNPAFDITPNEYVTAIITEKGIIRPPYTKTLAELFLL